MCRCCSGSPAGPEGEAFRGRMCGPAPWAPRWRHGYERPTKAERKEWLEEQKRRLQEELSEVDDELGKLSVL